MRLVSYLGLDDAGTAVLVDGRLIPVMDGYLTGADLEPASLDDLRHRAETLAGATGIAFADVRTIAPIPVPGKVVCVGLNYREHVSEGGRAGPPRPLLFSKFSNAVIADGEDIVRPEGTHALDLEVELGVVIGTTARRVSRSDALGHVAGYVVVNDVSARDWQGIPVALRRGRGRRWPVAARQGLGHVPADGSGVRDRRRDPGPADPPPALVAHPGVRTGRRARAARCRTARPPT